MDSLTVDRFSGVATVATVAPAAKSPRKAGKATKAKRPALPRAAKRQPDNLRRWSLAGVALMSTLSALLNGYAFSQHASIPAAGWALGIIIPGIVLIVGKVAGMLAARGRNRAALAMGAVGSGLLFLSVVHCGDSLAMLTGGSFAVSLPMAVAIDCGLIGCELASLLRE